MRRGSLLAGALALTVGFAACGDDDNTPAASSTTSTTVGTDEPAATTTTAAEQPAPDISGSDLRASLEFHLQEHVYLAGLATNEALAGRAEGFEAAAAALERNSNDITLAIGIVYGEDAGAAFGPLWKKHIGFFVDYTTGIAADDQPKADQAVADLTAYADEFGAFLESATEGGLTKDAVATLVSEHATTLIAAIDAQKAGDTATAFGNLKDAAGHMTAIADALAAAIAEQQGLS